MIIKHATGIHHVEFHTTCPQKLIDTFVRTYGFVLSATKTTCGYSQWLLESNQCKLIISTTTPAVVASEKTIEMNISQDHYDILTTLLADETTRNLVINRDTAFNIALAVTSVQSVLDRTPVGQVLVSRREAVDQYGSIEYACIKSCIGNVVHSIIDMSKYSGPYLPGFLPIMTDSPQEQQINQNLMCIIDHVAFAMPRNSSKVAIEWYENVLGLKRFVINQEDDPFQGFTVRVGSMGMRMFSSVYWKCSETGCGDAASKLKFVFAESLIDPDSGCSDQITKFIAKHKDQPGLQHIAFTCANSIKEVVRSTKANGAQFLSPCSSYYSQENNGRVIEAVGENADELCELGILLDDEADSWKTENTTSKSLTKVLLQIFTRSIFDNDTFFLELIERRGAGGFGAGNVRTLWQIVQRQMNHGG